MNSTKQVVTVSPGVVEVRGSNNISWLDHDEPDQRQLLDARRGAVTGRILISIEESYARRDGRRNVRRTCMVLESEAVDALRRLLTEEPPDPRP